MKTSIIVTTTTTTTAVETIQVLDVSADASDTSNQVPKSFIIFDLAEIKANIERKKRELVILKTQLIFVTVDLAEIKTTIKRKKQELRILKVHLSDTLRMLKAYKNIKK